MPKHWLLKMSLGISGLLISSCQEQDNQRRFPSGSSNPIISTGNATPASGNADVSQIPDDLSQIEVVYDGVVGPAIQDSCSNCHNPTGSAAFLPLDTADQLRIALGDDPDVATNPFLQRLNNDASPMPPGSNSTFRSQIIDLLNAWQDNNLL